MLTYRERSVEVMGHLVECASHGYSQASRWGDGGSEVFALSDGSSVEIATGDRDCSSGVCDACEAAKPGSTGGATYTGNMCQCFLSTGLWAWHPAGDGYVARPGDVYLNEARHPAMCGPDAGSLMQFSISETGGVDGAEGDQTGRESNVRAYYDYPWDGVLEYVGDEGPQEAQTGDEMICIIQPNGADCLVYFDGTRLHDLEHPDDVTALDMVYQATHGGAHIPAIALGTPEAPWASRLYQALYSGCPSEEMVPGLRCFAPRVPVEEG